MGLAGYGGYNKEIEQKISEVLKSDYGHKVSHDTVGRILSGG